MKNMEEIRLRPWAYPVWSKKRARERRAMKIVYAIFTLACIGFLLIPHLFLHTSI